MIAEVLSPVLHVKLFPPWAVSVTNCPPVIVVVEGLTVTVGLLLTVMVAVVDAEQPSLPTVTLYAVVLTGETVIAEVVSPVDQINDEPPCAVSMVLEPEQIV